MSDWEADVSGAQAGRDIRDFDGAMALGSPAQARAPRVRLLSRDILLLLAGLDLVLVAGCSLLAAFLYQLAVTGMVRDLPMYVAASVGLSAAFSLAAALDGQYGIDRLGGARSATLRAFKSFNAVFAFMVCVLFLTNVADTYSRGILLLQYAGVGVGLLVARASMVHLIGKAIASGYLEAQRIGLIGPREAVRPIAARLSNDGGVGVAAYELPSWAAHPLSEERQGELDVIAKRLIGALRASGVEEVLIVLPWSAVSAVSILVRRLESLPVGLNLLPEDDVFGPRALEVRCLSRNAVIGLQRPPLTDLDQVAKRVFDVLAASTILVLAAPLLVLVAVAIKLDSSGPVLFRQQRHGFNLKPFRITKFRTMTTMDDGPVVKQACANDPRVTAVGRVLRRSNLDELPQLYDVLRGEMSLVGPRPHAVAHDREYESKIPSYARRHNIKPGLTGWAQVNGFRGETDTDVKMEKRVEHDLFYIDNWSLLFDAQILIMTVFSKSAYRNAC